MTECSQCGDCCRFINVGRATHLRAVERDYLLARGAVLDRGFFLIPFPCPHLVDNKCDIHSTKPLLCKVFDGRMFKNHQVFYVPPTCSMGKKELFDGREE